jgi:hypothetical protein
LSAAYFTSFKYSAKKPILHAVRPFATRTRIVLYPASHIQESRRKGGVIKDRLLKSRCIGSSGVQRLACFPLMYRDGQGGSPSGFSFRPPHPSQWPFPTLSIAHRLATAQILFLRVPSAGRSEERPRWRYVASPFMVKRSFLQISKTKFSGRALHPHGKFRDLALQR